MTTKKEVTNKQFEEAYGFPHTSPANLTKKQIDNRNITHAVTKKYSKLLTEDDLHSCALKGVWRCLAYHEDNRGQKFTTSLYRFTDWECKRELRKKKKPKTAPNVISIMDFENFDIPDKEVDPQTIVLRECIDLLPDQHKTLIHEYFFQKLTMEEIGRKYSYSKEAARQKINKAVKKLREIYTDKT